MNAGAEQPRLRRGPGARRRRQRRSPTGIAASTRRRWYSLEKCWTGLGLTLPVEPSPRGHAYCVRHGQPEVSQSPRMRRPVCSRARLACVGAAADLQGAHGGRLDCSLQVAGLQRRVGTRWWWRRARRWSPWRWPPGPRSRTIVYTEIRSLEGGRCLVLKSRTRSSLARRSGAGRATRSSPKPSASTISCSTRGECRTATR